MYERPKVMVGALTRFSVVLLYAKKHLYGVKCEGLALPSTCSLFYPLARSITRITLTIPRNSLVTYRPNVPVVITLLPT